MSDSTQKFFDFFWLVFWAEPLPVHVEREKSFKIYRKDLTEAWVQRNPKREEPTKSRLVNKVIFDEGSSCKQQISKVQNSVTISLPILHVGSRSGSIMLRTLFTKAAITIEF